MCASLDGIIKGQNGIVEIKCPYNPTNYIKFLISDDVKKEYFKQYQFQLWVTGADFTDFVQYDPRMTTTPFKSVRFEKGEKTHKEFDELIPQFISDMDGMLQAIGISYGQQWARLAVKQESAVVA